MMKNYNQIRNSIQTDEIKLSGLKIINSLFAFIIIIVSIFSLSISCAQDKKDENQIMLTKWDRGIKLQSIKDSAGYVYLWFYEWHLFDGVNKGEHTPGSHSWEWIIDDRHNLAQMDGQWLKMSIEATKNGADITLQITNTTDYDWPEIAAIIPCLNPGKIGEVQTNPIFLDDKHEKTFFFGSDGLDLIKGQYPREIHFAHEFRPEIMAWEKEQSDGNFVFSKKWPTSDRDAYAGLIVRESNNNKWIMGIAWESYLSVQGHNPWNCMHLSVRVGPLDKGQTRTIRGKIYLFHGTKEDCLKFYKNDFPTNALLN